VAAGNRIRRYKAREFAELSGVTVRALHHYDRLGLLRPKRAHNGYRAYGEQDLVRLEQIVALKIRRPAFAADQNAAGPIRHAETAIAAGQRPDAAILTKIIEVMEMQNDAEWTMQYYNDAAQANIAERGML